MKKLSSWTPATNARAAYRASQRETDYFSLETFDKVQSLVTRGRLLQRFYEWNNWEDDMKPWISMKLDPPGVVSTGIMAVHQWWIVHFQDYYAIIECSLKSPQAVHRVKLQYRQRDGSVLWLASAQMGPLYFYSYEKIYLEYFDILLNHKFFMHPRDYMRVEAL